jgi:TPR repeat protein
MSRHHFLVTKDIADLFQDGLRLYEQQRFSQAAVKWGQAAILQHAASHAFLSNMLIGGKQGVSKNGNLAFLLASAGAALGCTHSKGVLARCYFSGSGVLQDIAKGLALGRESAAADSQFGLFVVGLCYESGRGVPRDENVALQSYCLAAEKGHIDSQYHLGLMFHNVLGDAEEAVRWYKLAAEQGHLNAQYNLGLAYEEGRGVTQDIAMADQLFRMAAKQGHMRAVLKLAK